MPVVITALNPSAAAAGDLLTISGSALSAVTAVIYAGPTITVTDVVPVAEADQVRSVVPEILRQASGEFLVSVIAGAEESNQLPLDLENLPPVEAVYPLATLADVKSALGVDSAETADDAKYQRLIRDASATIAGYCQRQFRVLDYQERYDGDGSPLLRLRHTPIVSVQSLSIDGTVVPSTDYSVYDEFLQCVNEADYSARLRTSGRIFPEGTLNVLVSYSAGYAVVPAEINHACVLQVSYLMNTLTRQGIVNEGNTTAGVQTSFSEGTLAPAVRSICNRYRPRKVAAV